jgi:hypothetical protein
VTVEFVRKLLDRQPASHSESSRAAYDAVGLSQEMASRQMGLRLPIWRSTLRTCRSCSSPGCNYTLDAYRPLRATIATKSTLGNDADQTSVLQNRNATE